MSRRTPQLDGLRGDRERLAARPCRPGRNPRRAVVQVEAEDRSIRSRLAGRFPPAPPARSRSRARRRSGPALDRVDQERSSPDDPARPHRATGRIVRPRVVPAMRSLGPGPRSRRDRPGRGDRPQAVAERDREVDRRATGLPNAPQRLILIPATADGMDGHASLQVDDRNDSEAHGRDHLSDRTPTILVHEWVTGGGMAGSPLPPPGPPRGAPCAGRSRRLRRLDRRHRRVIVTLDSRLTDDPGPWTVERIRAGDIRIEFSRPGSRGRFYRADRPGDDGHPGGAHAPARIDAGARLLGSSPEAVELAGDKARLAETARRPGIDTPPCRRSSSPRGTAAGRRLSGRPQAARRGRFGRHVPRGGHRSLPDLARTMAGAILQPFVPGQPMSASFLVDRRGRAWLIGDRRATHRSVADGRFEYRGGRCPSPLPWTKPRSDRPSNRSPASRVRRRRLHLG